MAAYPSCFTDDMIKALADCRHLVKYIDMPLQHINDQILHTMRPQGHPQPDRNPPPRNSANGSPTSPSAPPSSPASPPKATPSTPSSSSSSKTSSSKTSASSNSPPSPAPPPDRLHDTNPVSPEIASQRKEEIMLAQQQNRLPENAAFVGQTIKVLIDEVGYTKKKTAVARHHARAPDIDGRVLLRKAAGVTPTSSSASKSKTSTTTTSWAFPPPPQSKEPSKIEKSKIVRLSLPVVGVISTSVETKGKRSRPRRSSPSERGRRSCHFSHTIHRMPP